MNMPRPDWKLKAEHLERENWSLQASLKETLAEAVEHRKNIIECHTADPYYFANLQYKATYDRELARMDGIIERAKTALHIGVGQGTAK